MKPHFEQSPSFYNAIRSKVDAYLAEQHLTRFGGNRLLWKAIGLFSFHCWLYFALVSEVLSGIWAIVGCTIFGLSTAAIGCNIMHDGNHGTFSRHRWVNEIAASTLSLLGASRFIWRFKHNDLHHPFTNIHGADGDIEVYPMMRICPTQTHRWWHRYQIVYAWVLYAIYYPLWILLLDFFRYFTQQTNGFALPKMTLADHVAFWGFKALSLGLLLGFPMYHLGWAKGLMGFALFSMVNSFFITIIFQMAHALEHTDFPTMSDSGKMEEEWAIHQVRSTANFATNNRFWNWFCGGLNLQIEHHLFPGISHVHYLNIQTFVQDACLRHGIPYHEANSFGAALRSHWVHLSRMGKA